MRRAADEHLTHEHDRLPYIPSVSVQLRHSKLAAHCLPGLIQFTDFRSSPSSMVQATQGNAIDSLPNKELIKLFCCLPSSDESSLSQIRRVTC